MWRRAPVPRLGPAATSKEHFYRLKPVGRCSICRRLAQDGVFERLRGSQSHHCLCFDLDRLAGLWIPAHARLAMRLHRAPEVRYYEFSCAALALFHRELEELFKKAINCLSRRFQLIRQKTHDLRLAHRLCHLDFLSSSSVPNDSSLLWRPEPGPRTRDTIKRVSAQRKRKCKKPLGNC
jgi:hypothetical protein